MNGLPLNRALRDDNGEIYDIVAGTFLVTGLTDDSFRLAFAGSVAASL